jgi:hypothetical protein
MSNQDTDRSGAADPSEPNEDRVFSDRELAKSSRNERIEAPPEKATIPSTGDAEDL